MSSRHKGDLAEHWLGVVEGIIQITTVSPSGKSVTFTGVPTGGWFGEGAVLKSEIRKYDVMALRRSRIAFIPRETFQWLLDTSLPFTRFLLMQFTQSGSGSSLRRWSTSGCWTSIRASARAVSSLFNEHLASGLGKLLEISREEIGLLAGISRQRANQALKVLEQQGLVRVDYGGDRGTRPGGAAAVRGVRVSPPPGGGGRLIELTCTSATSPGLAAEVAGGDHLAHQHRRTVLRIGELGCRALPHRQHRIQADHVRQRQRSIGWFAAQLHPPVDFLRRRQASPSTPRTPR